MCILSPPLHHALHAVSPHSTLTYFISAELPQTKHTTRTAGNELWHPTNAPANPLTVKPSGNSANNGRFSSYWSRSYQQETNGFALRLLIFNWSRSLLSCCTYHHSSQEANSHCICTPPPPYVPTNYCHWTPRQDLRSPHKFPLLSSPPLLTRFLSRGSTASSELENYVNC